MSLFTPYLLYIKIGLIVGLCAICSFFTYDYQKNKYEAKLTKIENDKIKAIATLTQNALEQERINNETTQALNKRAIEQANKVGALLASNRQLLDERGRLHIQSNNNQTTARVADTTPGNTSNTTSETILPAGFSEHLLTTLARCDEAASYAAIAHEYAKQIQQQREEMVKEKL